MHSKAATYLNFNSNLCSLREKLSRDLNLKQHLFDIQYRSSNRNNTFRQYSPPISRATTITTLPNQTSPINKVTSVRDNLYNSKQKTHRINTEQIQLNNDRFHSRLKRISSPLSRNRFKESYTLTRKYIMNCRKVTTLTDGKKRANNIMKQLPMLYTRGSKFVSY